MTKKQINIVVATESKDKIKGIYNAFIEFFPEKEYSIKIYSSNTDSGVPSQPFGNETYQGAINRINNVRNRYEQTFKAKNINIDYYVSCEAGIDNTNKIDINNKQSILYSSEQVVCIYDLNNDNYSFGKSSSWTIPERDIDEIKETSLDSYLRKIGCTGLHDIGNGKYISRSDAVKEGTQSAIASLILSMRNQVKNAEREQEQ